MFIIVVSVLLHGGSDVGFIMCSKVMVQLLLVLCFDTFIVLFFILCFTLSLPRCLYLI